MNIKISEMPQATNVGGNDIIPIVQSGVSKKANVSQLNNYSTTEHVVGTWIDGKPVYEITIVNYSVTLSNNSALIGQLNVSADHFVSVDWAVGTPTTQNNAWRTGYLSSDYYSGVQVSMVNNKYNIYIFAKDSTTNPIKAMATIRYTKTTDSATRGTQFTRGIEQNSGELVGTGNKAEINIEEKTNSNENEVVEIKNENIESGDVK